MEILDIFKISRSEDLCIMLIYTFFGVDSVVIDSCFISSSYELLAHNAVLLRACNRHIFVFLP